MGMGSTSSRFRSTATITLCAVGLAFGVQWLVGPVTAAPRIEWSVAESAVQPFSEVKPYTPVRCTLELDEPAFVYAVSFDLMSGALALFPSETLRSDVVANPLPAGTHAFPGRHLERTLSWETSDANGAMTYMLITSPEPLDELQTVMKRMRQVGNAAFPQKPLLGNYAPAVGMDEVWPRSDIPSAPLRAAFGLEEYDHDGPMVPLPDGVHASALRLLIAGATAQQGGLAERVQGELQRELGSVLSPGSVMTPGAPK